MSLMSSPRPLPVRRLRRHGVARWWLAGFLVGCLLPATLCPVDALRNSERSAYVAFFVPAVLRAQSRHTTDHLHIEMAHSHHTLASFSHYRKGS